MPFLNKTKKHKVVQPPFPIPVEWDSAMVELYETIRNGGEVVDLSSKRIGDNGAKAIAGALEDPETNVKQLFLHNNSIGAEGGVAIGKALESNSTLTALYLYNNSIGDEGGMAIGKSLESNSTLTKLYLASNSIGVEGGIAIGKSLESNSTLTVLRLYNNGIGDEGGVAIGKALESNSTLTELDLYNNSIGAEGGMAIAKALESNSTLTVLYLNNISIGDEVLSQIKTLMEPANREKRSLEMAQRKAVLEERREQERAAAEAKRQQEEQRRQREKKVLEDRQKQEQAAAEARFQRQLELEEEQRRQRERKASEERLKRERAAGEARRQRELEEQRMRRQEDTQHSLVPALGEQYNDSRESLRQSLCAIELKPPVVVSEDYLAEITKQWTTQIARGAQGNVYKGYDEQTNTVYAIKQMFLSGKGFENEKMALAQLDHPNIIRLLGFCVGKNVGYLVYEYAAGGTVWDVLTSNDDGERKLFHWRRRVHVMLQVALALQFCHKLGIKHRDVKPENVCFSDAEYRTPLLIDFGIATDKIGTMTTIGGTRPYMAPEYNLQSRGKQYFDESTEVYAFGVLMIALLTSHVSETQLESRKKEALSNLSGLARCADKYGGKWDPTVLKQIAMLVQQCLQPLPSKRPTFGALADTLFSLREQTATKVLPTSQAEALADAIDASFGGSILKSATALCRCGQPSCLSCVESQHPFCLTCLESSVEAQTWSDAIRCNRKGCECIFELADLKGVIDDELLANHAVSLQSRAKRDAGESQLASVLKNINERIEEISEKVAEKSGVENGIAFAVTKQSECPNLCVLWPVNSSRFSFRRPFSKEYRLHFLCSFDRTPVASSIEIRKPRTWVTKVLPVLMYSLWTLNVLCKVLSFPVPIPVPGRDDFERLENLAISLSDVDTEDIEEMISSLESLQESQAGIEELQRMIINRAEGLDSNAQAAIAKIALKPGNRGWLDEMGPAQSRTNQWAWVKRSNVEQWRACGL